MPANRRVVCPYCPANGENQTYEVGRGLNIHITKKHPEKKEVPIPEETSGGATGGVGAHRYMYVMIIAFNIYYKTFILVHG